MSQAFWSGTGDTYSGTLWFRRVANRSTRGVNHLRQICLNTCVGVGDDPCVLKKDCSICIALTPEQIQQLATPTYRTRKEKEQKTVSSSLVSATPTRVDPSQVSVLGRVEAEKSDKKRVATPAGKKKRPDESPKPSKKKSSSSKPTSEDLKNLNDKWAQRFARLEAMLLSKLSAVLLEPVKKPAAVVTSKQPSFDPGVGSSMMSVTQPAKVSTGVSPVQATRDVTATQHGEAPGTRGKSAATMTATRPVEAPGTGRSATQSVETPSARTATQLVEAPGASSDVQFQHTGTGSGDGSAVDQSLTSTRTVIDNTGVSDTEDEMASEPESPAAESDRDLLSDTDPVKEDKLDQEHSEEANYRETMKGVRSFMGWHQIPDFGS